MTLLKIPRRIVYLGLDTAVSWRIFVNHCKIFTPHQTDKRLRLFQDELQQRRAHFSHWKACRPLAKYILWVLNYQGLNIWFAHHVVWIYNLDLIYSILKRIMLYLTTHLIPRFQDRVPCIYLELHNWFWMFLPQLWCWRSSLLQKLSPSFPSP